MYKCLLLFFFSGTSAGTVKIEKRVTAVLGIDVTLTCYYEALEREAVSQIEWSKKGLGGQSVQIAILSAEHGAHVYKEYEGRVKQKSPLQPEDGTIILKNAVQADEGTYQCKVTTFPSGNFEVDLLLNVLVPPLPTLNPGPPLVEGVGQTLAASCTAEGSPAPILTWQTEVIGTNSSRAFLHSRSASVTSEFYVVPVRSMNGKALTCVVSHPGFREEKRITHVLSVKYLAETSIQGHDGWFVGKDGAALQCLCDGNPPPVYKWSRENGSLPQEVTFDGNRLIFPGPLTAGDAGLYTCKASNDVGSRQASVSVYISENEPRKVDLMSMSLVSVGVVTAVLLVILVITVVLVNRHHKKKTKRLSEKILRDPSISSIMGEDVDRRSYSTLTTVRETETQTELLSTVPDEEVKEESEGEEEGMDEKDLELSDRGSTGVMENQPFIKQGMTHFYQENGTLRAKPSTNGIYINGRGHLV
uniref:Nectin-4 n=1 Tax=Pyxicephalus adspersus TaxID=30357 RepID=A0AAV2ZIP3_PYXAD|nr:TPA: hypothetical protein GDO54_004824 [Pyxicephalus adspersus]